MKPFTFQGLMAPVLTPFNDDSTQSINVRVISDYANYLLKSGIKGVLVNGTSGEGMSMTVSERKTVTEAWHNACTSTKQCLMVQIGGAVLSDVLDMAKHAEHLGVDAVLCLADLFNKPTNPTDLIAYLQKVSAVAPNTPLLYYHLPAFTGINIDMEAFLNQAYGKIPTLIGIKFTSSNLQEGAQCLAVRPDHYTIFLGNDQLMLAAFSIGFNSTIATSLNMLPEYGKGILDCVNNNKLEKARDLQKELTAKINIIIGKDSFQASWVSGMKAAMNITTDIPLGKPRSPLSPLTDKDIDEMKTKLSIIC